MSRKALQPLHSPRARRPGRWLRSRPGFRRAPRRRIGLVFLVFGTAIFGLVVRLYWLQLVRGDTLAHQALRQQAVHSAALALRRPIVDRRGEVIAFDDARVRVWAHPRYFQFPGDSIDQRRSPREVSERLAPVLGLSVQALEQQLSAQASGIRLAEDLSVKEGEAVKGLQISGIDIETYPQRQYPQGPVFANIVGFLDMERNPQAGLELSQDKLLQRVERGRRLVFTGDGTVLPTGLATGAIHEDALQLQLSLDARLQRAAHGALAEALDTWKASRGVAMVMDITNGELLAMASLPSYDANRFWEANPRLYREWSVEDLFEPGSTFKPVNLAIALEAGAITPRSTVEDTGTIVVGPWSISNHDDRANGTIDMARVLQVSSNVGMVRVMEKVPTLQYWQHLSRLGINQPPDTDLPGATAGYLKPFRRFQEDPIHGATAAFGQGISLTPLKLLQLHGAVANGGWLVQPHVTRGLRGGTTLARINPRPAKKRVFRADVTATVRSWMESVVEEGSGRGVRIAGYRIAGKTGTAQKSSRGYYVPGAVITSFIAHLPVEKPRYVVLVAVDEPQGAHTYGSTVAVPVAHAVIESLVVLEKLPPSPS